MRPLDAGSTPRAGSPVSAGRGHREGLGDPKTPPTQRQDWRNRDQALPQHAPPPPRCPRCASLHYPIPGWPAKRARIIPAGVPLPPIPGAMRASGSVAAAVSRSPQKPWDGAHGANRLGEDSSPQAARRQASAPKSIREDAVAVDERQCVAA